MKNNSLLVWGLIILVLAILAIVLIGGSWNGMMGTSGWGMMGPRWTISPMGGMMSVGPGEIIILLLGTITFVILAAWVLRSGGRQK